jgi:NADPH:quinone reductase
MKAIMLKEYGNTSNFEIGDLAIPQIKKGQIRIKIIAVSFNPVDYQIRKGLSEAHLNLQSSTLIQTQET